MEGVCGPAGAVHVMMTASPPGTAVTVTAPAVRHLPPPRRALPRISESTLSRAQLSEGRADSHAQPTSAAATTAPRSCWGAGRTRPKPGGIAPLRGSLPVCGGER